MYLYLAQSKLPETKLAIRKVETLVARNILLSTSFFKLVTELGKESAVLTVPKSYADVIIIFYQESLFSGHHGITKTHL